MQNFRLKSTHALNPQNLKEILQSASPYFSMPQQTNLTMQESTTDLAVPMVVSIVLLNAIVRLRVVASSYTLGCCA